MKYVTVYGQVTVSASILLYVDDNTTNEKILEIAKSYEENIYFDNMRTYGRPEDDIDQWFIQDDGTPYNLEVEEN